MLSEFGKQDSLSKEEARIKMKREANEARRLRLLDARRRVIGLDVDALNEQVAEKERMKSDQKEIERLDRLRIMEIERIMEAASTEERALRDYQNQELKKSWEASITAKGVKSFEPSFNPDSTGVSAAQTFAGEDRNRPQRLKEQKSQMTHWIQEQVADKQYMKMLNRGEADKYTEMMRAVDSIREAAEIEEREMQRYLNNVVKDDNAKLAMTQRENRQYLKNLVSTMPLEDQWKATSISMPDESAASAMDEHGRIIRKDMFKGYTEAQRRRIMQENGEVAQAARERKEAEVYGDQDYAIQQTLMNRTMEYAAYEEQKLKREMNLQQTATLQQQALEQAQKRFLSKQEKYGSIDPEFFSNFGKSCR